MPMASGFHHAKSSWFAISAWTHQAHQPRRCVCGHVPVFAGLLTKVAVACLEIFTSGSANQPLGDAHDPPKVSPPTPTVRTKRAFRSAPVVLVRGVRMPACAETGTSIVMQHGLPRLSSRGYSQPGGPSPAGRSGASAQMPAGWEHHRAGAALAGLAGALARGRAWR